MNQSITCRQCKEQPGTWEIQDQNGTVRQKHYNTQEECINEGNKLAQEYGEKFNKLADEIEAFKKKIRELNPKVL